MYLNIIFKPLFQTCSANFKVYFQRKRRERREAEPRREQRRNHRQPIAEARRGGLEDNCAEPLEARGDADASLAPRMAERGEAGR